VWCSGWHSRQTEGLIGPIIGLLGLALRVPDYTTLSRRAATLEVPQPQRRAGTDDEAEPLHLLVDSTGLRLCGVGHIVASSLTPHDTDDASQISPLLDQVIGSVASVTGDGAYDQDGVYADVADQHPEAAVIVPPRSTAVLSKTAATAPTQCDHHLRCTAEMSRMGWQKSSGYNKWAKAETATARWKRVTDDGPPR
jgi:hypothetical protein